MEKKEFVFNGATLSGFPMLSLNLLLTVVGIAAIACGAFADCGDALTVACAWGALAAAPPCRCAGFRCGHPARRCSL